MLKELFFALWFFMPAGVANMMPIFAAHIPQLKRLDAPMDFGKSFCGKRIFGSHKTWRGLVAGIIFGTVTLALQQLLVAHIGWLHTWTDRIDYAKLPTLLLGPLFAIGALGGDAIESFFKRQVGIPPGHGWFPFDQTDYIIGAAIASIPFVALNLWQYVALVLMWLVIHLVASVTGYFMGVKE
ncbi:MAG TPA: CDP-archaeol synthase, partial [Verrucomicrobiae bacterium]|nr:CDP-archaeol synthase [Verrucomicrobiae bacterium]